MRLLVERILSLVAAFLLSLLVVSAFFGGNQGSYAWTIVPSRLQRWAIEIELTGQQEDLTVEEIDDWLAGRPTPTLDEEWMLDVEPDPWRRPYRCVDLATKGGSGLGFYSTGADGISTSDGDDPDDVNSWSQAPLDYYWGDVGRRLLLMHMGAAGLLTPITYHFAGMVAASLAAVFRRSADSSAETSS